MEYMKGKKLLLGALLLSSVLSSQVMASSALDEALYACNDLESIYTITAYMDPTEAIATFENLPDWKRNPKYSIYAYERTLADGTLERMGIVYWRNSPLKDFDLTFETPKYRDAAQIYFKLKAKLTAAYGAPGAVENNGYDQSFSYIDDDYVAHYSVFLSKRKDGSGLVYISVMKSNIGQKMDYDHSKYGHD